MSALGRYICYTDESWWGRTDGLAASKANAPEKLYEFSPETDAVRWQMVGVIHVLIAAELPGNLQTRLYVD